MNKNKIIAILAIIIAILGWKQFSSPDKPTPVPAEKYTNTSENRPKATKDFEHTLQQAYQSRQNNLQIEGQGIVIKTLPDDNKGSKHQRFIIKLNSGQTLLVAHNIDLAPKIKNLRKSDTIGFYGEYEWSEQGGVIHWTHHDPAKRHEDGWLSHNGQIYQ